jgi:hypothetical protein
MIVPAAYAPLARALCVGLAGESGEGMFETGLSANGVAPATHFISSGHIRAEFADLMANATAVHAAAQAVGSQVTLQQIQALLSASDISDADLEPPFAAMARKGLRMVAQL